MTVDSMHNLTGYDADQLDQIDQASVMQLMAVQSAKRKAEVKDKKPGVLVDEAEAVIPLTRCTEGVDNAMDLLYAYRFLRPPRGPVADWFPLTPLKGWEPALPEHMKHILGTEGCIPPAAFLAMHERQRRLEIKHYMEKNRGNLPNGLSTLQHCFIY